MLFSWRRSNRGGSCPLEFPRYSIVFLLMMEFFDSPSALKGLYPCGEGAGYAGGILSAAVDGIRAAERVLESY